ncbi:unnamed protein product [Angiostrongylus costaricensis]|uniref:C2H2-type domain-containing protein n=1 Tax=Angiostrongylus costaricensis TaxID=334426 RepID=A0A158PED3_ANGCS|nr:unnamed protein product [Angiostrongylus costaricensis]
MPDCDWKGAYRSLRCDHMRWCHKDWVMPPRYILQRITKDGIYIDPKTFVPPFSCPVEGCEWRGSYRASRSQHIKSAHPCYVPPKKKAPIGGYVADGKYLCHIPQCTWRGISRSTRASHMRKVHGGFANPAYSTRQVSSNIIIQWVDGRLTVIGCVEHTGHRMGTALLRLSTNERVVLDEYLYVVDDKVPLDAMLDRIRGEIAEWHLLSEWATRLDEMVSNRVDRFAIICALRRWTRYLIDMFEAFREMELNSLAQLVDSQLTDPEFAKRWTPLNRNPLTDHSNPVLEISCRIFRERFLNCELCARLDEYAGLLVERIAEFNALMVGHSTIHNFELLFTHIYEDM